MRTVWGLWNQDFRNCWTAFNTASVARQTVDNTLGNMVNSKQIRRTKKGVYALNPKDIQRISSSSSLLRES